MEHLPREQRSPANDAEIKDYLHRLGLPGLIDLHVHFMPQNVLDKVWAFFDGREADGDLPWPISYRTDEAQRVATLEQLGVARFSTLNYAHRPGMADWLNEYSKNFAALHPQAIASGTFYPEEGTEQQVRDCLESGVEVFKIHVQVGNFDPNDPLLDRAWQLVAEARTPVIIHCGNGPLKGQHTGIEPIRRLLARHEDLVLVIAHAGLPDYREFAELALEHPNVYLDTTMLATDFTEQFAPMPEGYRALLAQLAGKVVLGTDFPNIPYPYSHQLQALDALGLGEQWMREVLWETPQRLLAQVRAAV
ncbi:amidohydrolase family protein [Glutamicibacter soli]|uniref:amidohydrolase family protein n=1 Tax=Micrococcaceae TaxID=1268 RepID=UPI000EB39615|nr:amidohydrolase family protein [Arthrobacter sp. AG1021]RKS20588.1 hypothetical protein DFO58_1118 [Arthrobacter sp. AG1021]